MIQLENVSKKFGTGVAGLIDITLSVDKGEFIFLVGATGSGKTTMFRLLIREMLPTTGSIIVGDFDVVRLPKNKIPHLRKKVGVVFQDLKLLMDRTILENVLLPLEVIGIRPNEAIQKAENVLMQVGILDQRDKFPVQLSGGELQRAAIARSLILSPEVLLADEPTGNLDPDTSEDIVKLLEDINSRGTTVIMATHNLEIVNKRKKRIVGLEKGKIIRDDESKEHHAKHGSDGVKETKGTGEKRETEEAKEKK